jgi:DNA-binding CsgD family transcriptional regulator
MSAAYVEIERPQLLRLRELNLGILGASVIGTAREVLALVARGKPAREIGKILNIAKRTVDAHAQTRKLGTFEPRPCRRGFYRMPTIRSTAQDRKAVQARAAGMPATIIAMTQ